MNPIIRHITQDHQNNILTFTLESVNVSFANALRRTIITDIPTVIFRTEPHEENECIVYENTSRLHNEILGQRLGCIPIHIQDFETIPLEMLIMELDIENKTDTILYVTTKDFKIKNKESGAYLSEKDRDSIFPPDSKTGYYIDFVVLRPFISEDLLGEKIHLTCPFSISSVKTNSMYNTTSCCSYGYTPDTSKIKDTLIQKKKEWKEQGLKEEEIEFQGKNWLLLDAQRITVSDSFDFIVETVGVFTNESLVQKACDILVDSLKDLQQLNDTNELQIKPSNSTLQNSLDVVLVNEDYTVGRIIEYVFYSDYFSKTVDYVGFKKVHPYDTFSTLRVAYKEKTEISLLRQDLNDCIHKCIVVFQKIKQIFNKN